MSLIALVALLLWSHRSPMESPSETSPQEPLPVAAARQALEDISAQSALVDEAAMEPIPATGFADPASRAIAASKLDETIQIYRDTMVYPLSSRPADGSNEHLTHWNRPISVGQPFAVDANKREIQANAQIDRVFAAPGVAVAVVVTASYSSDGSPATLDEVGAELQWRDRKANEWVAVQAVPLRRAAGGWVGSVIPSQVDALRAPIREARILTHARVGEFEREFTLDFSYAVEQPVVVHGIASDRIRAGSLELELDVELSTAATVALQATLFASDGTTAIAVFDDRYVPKRAGRQVIPIQFFGKVLHDRNINGPYRLGAVHGYVYRYDLEPDQLFFDRADLPAMTTSAHAASAFSPDRYQSPEVAARLAHYEAVREALRAGRPPPPPP
jgi:hypothetical protein